MKKLGNSFSSTIFLIWSRRLLKALPKPSAKKLDNFHSKFAAPKSSNTSKKSTTLIVIQEKKNLAKKGQLRLPQEGCGWKAPYKGEIRHSLTSMLTTRCINPWRLHLRRNKVYAVEAHGGQRNRFLIAYTAEWRRHFFSICAAKPSYLI